MSTGNILGAIGAVVGFIVGGPQGASIGYSIGSGIGNAIDPPKIEGPKLTDGAQQTGTVGVPIPFGYGKFPVAGNVIWAAELKERKKTERTGKGSGPKVTTYTYTRSYAIGVCEGPIYRFLQIKRNGKVVYDWSGMLDMPPGLSGKEQMLWIAQHQVYLNWIRNTVLYLGGETQMPDSTITAYEGVGNVAPFRGLAYIVVTDDDLTDLRGAIPQYEFVVQTIPDVYLHSKIYPLELVDAVASRAAVVDEAPIGPVYAEGASASQLEVLSGDLRDIYQAYLMPPEAVSDAPLSVISGVLSSVLVSYGRYPPEAITDSAVSVISGSLVSVLIQYSNYPPEGVDASQLSVISGTLA